MKRKHIDWNSPKILKQVFELARKGNTLKEIAKNLGCGLSTLKNRMAKDETLKDQYKRGFEICSIYVNPIAESALIKNITGYDWEEKKVLRKHVGFDKKGKPLYEITQVQTTKHVRGSVDAQKFYLINNTDYYKPINKITPEEDNNKGWIRQYMEMEKERAMLELENEKESLPVEPENVKNKTKGQS